LGLSFQSLASVETVPEVFVWRGEGVVDLVLGYAGGLLLWSTNEEPITCCLISSTSVGGLGSSFMVISGGETRKPPSLVPPPPPLANDETSFSFFLSFSFSSCLNIP
jgi:hypothetical protein